MLVLHNVGKTYPNGVRALDGVTIEIGLGEIVVVVGGSGCGKSTLLRVVSGLDRPTQGTTTFDGRPITAPQEKIGIVFEEPRLLPWLSVAGNVGFGLEHRPREERARRVAMQLERVGLHDKAGVWPRELSGGQAQRTALARALVTRPEVLLLDEPFSALDAFTRADLQDHLLDLWADFQPTLPVVGFQAALAGGDAGRGRGGGARGPHHGHAPASRRDVLRGRGRSAAPARPPVGRFRFRQAPRAHRARPFARSRGRGR